jgi:hypothetical protein
MMASTRIPHFVVKSPDITLLGRNSITFLPTQNNNFIVRNNRFEALDKLLSPYTTYHAAAIWGLGGCG